MTSDEIGMSGIDVTSLHTGQKVNLVRGMNGVRIFVRDHIRYELRGRIHALLEEIDDDGIETLA